MRDAMQLSAMALVYFFATATELSISITVSSATTDRTVEEISCALTFDDGPGNYTEKLLDLLKEKHTAATFFVVGEQVMRLPQIRMVEIYSSLSRKLANSETTNAQSTKPL